LTDYLDIESGTGEEQVLCFSDGLLAKCSFTLRNGSRWLRLQTNMFLERWNTPQFVDHDFDWSLEAFEAQKQYHLARRGVQDCESSCVEAQDSLTLASLSKELVALRND
jgi:hypothetical protein